MIYSILIYEAPGMADARRGEEEEKVLEAHRALQQDTKQSGVYIGATQLSEAGAMTVRYREGDSIVTDGPFAETKELFIGFYLFDCASMDEALALAKRIPISEMGSVEVRPAVWAESKGLDPA